LDTIYTGMGNTLSEPMEASQRPCPKVIAGIPAYNQENNIGEVIRKASEYVDEVIVADDGSVDNTAQVAEAAGAIVIRSELNQGAGHATKTCFRVAKERDADVLVTLDSDGQHNAEEIPRVLAPVIERGADLVIGSRFLDDNYNIPRYRRFGINVITSLLNIASRVKVSDSQSCFRSYSKRAIDSLHITEKGFAITEKGFAFSIELLVQARRKGLAISEVPISCIYHSESHTRNPVVHGVEVALSVIRLRLMNRKRYYC